MTRFRNAASREGAPIIIATGMKAHPVNISAPSTQNRHRGFDLLRVIAIYMVMQIHTGEFEYEAVIEASVIEGHAGPPTVVAVETW